jgi:hypothetical protein
MEHTEGIDLLLQDVGAKSGLYLLFIYLFILFIYEWMSGCLLDMHKIESRYGFDKDVSMSIALLYCVSGCDWDTTIKFVSLFWL